MGRAAAAGRPPPFGSIAAELVERDDDLADLAGRGPAQEDVPPRLLGVFDPLLCGWATRQPFTGDHDAEVAVGGMFRPVALVRGRAVGTWGLPGGRVALDLLDPLAPAEAAALDREVADVERFLSRTPDQH